MVLRFKTEMQFSQRPLVELIEDGKEFSLCKKAMEYSNYRQHPCEALDWAGQSVFYRDKDKMQYHSLVSGLGKSDLQGQLEHLELHLKLLEESLGEARLDCVSKSKLYVVLGLFSTLTVCIVFL